MYAKMQSQDAATRDLARKLALLENERREERIRTKGLETKLNAAEEAIRALRRERGDGNGAAANTAAAMTSRFNALEVKIDRMTETVDKTAARRMVGKHASRSRRRSRRRSGDAGRGSVRGAENRDGGVRGARGAGRRRR